MKAEDHCKRERVKKVLTIMNVYIIHRHGTVGTVCPLATEQTKHFVVCFEDTYT